MTEEEFKTGVMAGAKGDTTASNPKDALGVRKAPLSAVPAPVLFELGLAMLDGAVKYGRHNYRAVGVRASVYYDAALRHIMRWYEGEENDADSGLPHLAHAMACLTILRDGALQGNLNDDRPPRSPAGWMDSMNSVAQQRMHRAGGSIAKPYTEKAHGVDPELLMQTTCPTEMLGVINSEGEWIDDATYTGGYDVPAPQTTPVVQEERVPALEGTTKIDGMWVMDDRPRPSGEIIDNRRAPGS